MFSQTKPIPYQHFSLLNHIQLSIKRLDCVHPTISGNKFFKLKYNFHHAQQLGYRRILSFGGAYSNHIFALAHAAHEFGFKSIGIIRGAELALQPLNSHLQSVHELGMQLDFVSRTDYRRKNDADYLALLQQQYPDAYIIPEGGSNLLAVQGCSEILSLADRQNYDVICCAVGTGGTIAGIINASHHQQYVLGFAALKGDFLGTEIKKWTKKTNWTVISDETFGGYAKYSVQLLDFINEAKRQYQLPLEPIYTGKAFYQLMQRVQQGKFCSGTRILFIHTGGLHPFTS